MMTHRAGRPTCLPPLLLQASSESVLSPRFYTTDFDEMEQLFSQKLNPNLDMAELEVCSRGGLVSHNARVAGSVILKLPPPAG